MAAGRAFRKHPVLNSIMKSTSIHISNKTVGYDHPCYVVAEAGVNHNGRLPMALKLIDAAVHAGADAIKFQTFVAKEVTIGTNAMAKYQKQNLKRNISQLDMLKKLELKKSFYGPIIKHCKKKKIEFLSTPHGGFSSIDFLQSLRVQAFKFGSGDLNNFPVLTYAAKYNKPMILGTGMSTLEEVRAAIRCITQTGNNKIIALHATTNYPCPLNEVNLRAMVTMMNRLPCLVGYSDHTLGIETSVAATALGACVIEKHFTLDTGLPGPDHKASATPEELSSLITNIRHIYTLMGSDAKQPNPSELGMLPAVRKSVVALNKINKGEKFTKKNIGIKRPGTGLNPKFYYKILGTIARADIKEDTLIKKNQYA